MEILAALPLFFAIIIFILWIIAKACEGVRGIGRTTLAVGEWNKEQLEKRSKRERKHQLEAELRELNK